MTLRERLAERMGEVRWSDLRAHAARDAIILVARDLDLLDVGVAVATDEKERVAAWIEAGRLRKPSAADLGAWERDGDARFVSVVVQPFVLVHEAGDPRQAN